MLLGNKLGVKEHISFIGRQSNIADYLYQSKLQITGLANNPIIEGIVTNTPTIAVELGELSKNYSEFEGLVLLSYDRGGYGRFPSEEHSKLVTEAATEIVRILNNYEACSVDNYVDYSQYGWDRRIDNEISLYQNLIDHNCR